MELPKKVRNRRATAAARRAARFGEAPLSLAPLTSSAYSLVAPVAAHSNPVPPFAIAREPERPSATTKRESREVRSVNTHPASPIASLASQPPPPVPRGSHTPTHPAIPPFSTERERDGCPAVTAREPQGIRSQNAQRASPTASTASNTPIATLHDSRTPPRHTIRPSATETESKKGAGPRVEDVCTASAAQGEYPHPVRIPVPPASRTHAATSHDVPAPPSSTTHPPTTEDESRYRGEARGDEAQAPHAHTESPTPPSAQPTSPSTPPNVSAPAYNDAKMPAPGVEPGEPRMAAASFLKNANTALLHPARVEELVAFALREGHEAGLKEGWTVGFRWGLEAGKRASTREDREEGLKEGRDAGFREGLEAGKRAGKIEGHEEGLREGVERGRLERSSSIDAIQLRLLQAIRLDAYDKGYAEGGKDARYDAQGELETVLAREHTRGYLEGREVEYRSWVDKEIEAQSSLEDLKFWEGYRAAQQIVNAQVQTISEPIVPPAPVNIQPLVEPVISSATAPLSWADDADLLPITVVSSLCSSAPRDFSVLRSDSVTRPFGSLQRRARRSHRPRSFLPHSHISWPSPSSIPIATRHHPAGIHAGQPSLLHVSACSSTNPDVQSVPLDWDGDQRLVELGRVLRGLGWVRS